MSEQISVKVTGTLPLLMHCERLANPLDPATRKVKEITDKKRKTIDDYEALSYAEFEGGIYHDPEIGPYVPAHWILGMVRDAGKLNKRGRDVVRAIVVNETKMPVIYDGPRSIEDLWKKKFYDRRMAGNQGRRVLRTRPKFDKWSVEFSLQFDESVFDRHQLVAILNVGGRMIGLGDYRPVFGRFEAEVRP